MAVADGFQNLTPEETASNLHKLIEHQIELPQHLKVGLLGKMVVAYKEKAYTVPKTREELLLKMSLVD